MWLDNHLLPPERPDGEADVAGELWAVHGGGFYRARKYQVAPAISPDGKCLAYLSEKNLFTVYLFLADAKTGQVLRKLTSKISSTHIDEFNFIE